MKEHSPHELGPTRKEKARQAAVTCLGLVTGEAADGFQGRKDGRLGDCQVMQGSPKMLRLNYD